MNKFFSKVSIFSTLLIGLVIFGACVGFMSALLEDNEISSPTQTTPTTAQSTSTTAPTPAPTWKQVAKWEGSSIKNTETFHISSNEWRIRWSAKPGEYGDMNFIIYVYEAKKDIPEDVVANIIGEGSDVSYMRGAGDYYLSINTAQPYTIIVEEKK